MTAEEFAAVIAELDAIIAAGKVVIVYTIRGVTERTKPMSALDAKAVVMSMHSVATSVGKTTIRFAVERVES